MNLRSLRRSTWAIPSLLGVGCFAALILALMADGIWDVLSWAILAAPLLIVGAVLINKSGR